MNKGRQRLRFGHARIAHLAHRPVGGGHADNARLLPFRQRADGRHDCPELGGFTHPGVALHQGKAVGGFKYHARGVPLPVGQARQLRVRNLIHQRGDGLLSLKDVADNAFFSVVRLA